MLCVAIHVYRNILSAQCRIQFEEDSNTIETLQVEFNSSRLRISLLQGDILHGKFDIFAPEEFFIPTSVSSDVDRPSFKIRKDDVCFTNQLQTMAQDGKQIFESCFRIQISNIEALRLTEAGQDSYFEIQDFFNPRMGVSCGNQPLASEKEMPQHSKSRLDIKDILKLTIKPEHFYRLQCTVCDTCVGTAIFQKVEEYCNEFSSESWFCHPTEAHLMSTGVDVCVMSTRSLYLDEVSFYLSETFLALSHCQCGSLLFAKESHLKGFVRVYFDKILFRNSIFPTVDGREYSKQMSLLTLWSLIEKSQTTSLFSKIFLQSKENNQNTCLLLMVPSETVAQFVLQGPVSKIPRMTHLVTEAVHKVLFCVGTPDSSNVKSWRYDFNVDFYWVSNGNMDTITELLKKSSDYIPGNKSSVAGFSYGCLPARSTKLENAWSLCS